MTSNHGETVLAANQHGWQAGHNGAAMYCLVAQSGGGFSTNQYRFRAKQHGVRWTNAHAHIARAGGRLTADQNGRSAGRQQWATHVRNWWQARCHHRAKVVIARPGGRLSHVTCGFVYGWSLRRWLFAPEAASDARWLRRRYVLFFDEKFVF